MVEYFYVIGSYSHPLVYKSSRYISNVLIDCRRKTETYRDTHRDKETHTEIDRQRQRDIQRYRERYIEKLRHRETHTERQKDKIFMISSSKVFFVLFYLLIGKENLLILKTDVLNTLCPPATIHNVNHHLSYLIQKPQCFIPCLHLQSKININLNFRRAY